MAKNVKTKVFVALSGGVDSSVAALLLQKQGYDVTGVFMRCYNIDGCAERDAEDARRVASSLGIPFYIFDFEDAYKKSVVGYMIEGYRQSLTPNPDVMCNKTIKFDLFLKEARKMGADLIATGHYVRIKRQKAKNEEGKKPSFLIRNSLLIARDANKDQSYFLWTLTQDQLKYCLFPIGEHIKPAVRKIAARAGLPTARKKDSQGICFLGTVSLPEFLKTYIPPAPGPVLDTEGRKIGTHSGAAYYTIGQRHLGIKNYESKIRGRHKTEAHYVVEKNAISNTVVVAEGTGHPALYRTKIELADVNFINPKNHRLLANRKSLPVLARVRYRQPLAAATLYKPQDTKYSLEFTHPQKAIASGQSAVFYSKQGKLLGGGIITHKNYNEHHA